MHTEDACRAGDLEPQYRVAVLMSAYGCSPFMREQLLSIREQLTHEDLLVVVDDGSRSVDWSTLEDWPYPYLCWSRRTSVGSSVSFMELLLNPSVSARYYCWADQDDVWLPGKLHRQIEVLESSSAALACAHGWRPFSVGPDGSWVTSRAQTPVAQRSAAHYCFETPAPGMTLCLSHQARQLLNSIGDPMRLQLLKHLPHDRLACAVIGFHGGMRILNEPFVAYRQHGANQIGAPHASAWRRSLRRLRQVARSWQTARAGKHLYAGLAENDRSKSRNLPPLRAQRLRSTAWENAIFQFLARIR